MAQKTGESISGGSLNYYEIFKALKKEKYPENLTYSYEILSRLQANIFIKIWVCDSKYKENCINNDNLKCVFDKENDKCISKSLCNKISSISESSCKEATTKTPSLTKCIYERVGEEPDIQEKCVIKNICLDSLSEKDCNSAITLNIENKCIYNYEINKCEVKELCELENSPSLKL